MIKLLEKHWFKKDILGMDHAHISWSIRNKKFVQIGMICFNWHLQKFNFGFYFSIGKSGIDIHFSFWFSFSFHFIIVGV